MFFVRACFLLVLPRGFALWPISRLCSYADLLSGQSLACALVQVCSLADLSPVPLVRVAFRLSSVGFRLVVYLSSSFSVSWMPCAASVGKEVFILIFCRELRKVSSSQVLFYLDLLPRLRLVDPIGSWLPSIRYFVAFLLVSDRDILYLILYLFSG